MWYFLIVILAVSSYVDSSSIDSFSSASQSSRHKRNAEDESEPWKNPYLPNTIEPIRYDLNVIPHYLNNRTSFNGNVSIEINILNRTNTFIVHSKQLDITDRRVYDSSGTDMKLNHSYWEPNDYFVMQTEVPLQGKARLRFHFQGNMTLVKDRHFDCSGLYTVPYVNEEGHMSWMVVTDFGSSNSRYVFPNFDEPQFKANFRIKIKHYTRDTALSNMPMEGYEDPGSAPSHFTVFKLSPKMSSNQVAFAIINFHSKNTTVDGKQYRVWARPAVLTQADYALEVTPTIQSYLQRELDMPYSLEKLDQLAVPGYLLNSPTENWGLATYKESNLLVDATKGGDFARKEVLTHVAHTMAHNYFENLVTCRYWKHVWLNEGLATFYEIRAVKEVDPTLCYEDYFFGMKVESAIDADAADMDTALIPSAETSMQGNPTFDFVLKNKGAAILRMVENFVGADTFRRCIRGYLKKYAHATVVTDDLWAALQEEVGDRLQIKEIMTEWVELETIPVVKVELLTENKISANQTQFFSDPLFRPVPGYTWYVPLTYRIKGNTEQVIWMNRTNVVLELPLNLSDNWIEFNPDRTGYYRVNYDEVLLYRIAKQLKEDHTVFSELSRSKLLSDAVALAHSDRIGYDVFLNLTRYASKENGLTPWLHIYAGFNEFHRIFNTTCLCCLQNYILNLTNNLMDKLQVKDEGTYIEKQLRPRIMSLSCSSGHQGCIDNTTMTFRAWLKNETANAVPKNIRREVYCIGLANSLGELEWNITLARYRKATSKDEQTELLRALTCSKNMTLLERLLDFSVQNTTTGKARFSVAAFIAANPSSNNLVWNWLKRKYTEIDQTWGTGYAKGFVPLAVHTFSTLDQYDEVQEFYSAHSNSNFSHEEKEATRSVIDTNKRWMHRHFKIVNDWLKEKAHTV